MLFPGDNPGIGLALLGELERAARRADADALLCTTAARAMTRLLRRQAYLRASANVHFFLRDRSATHAWPPSLPDWWLARGDGHSDEVF